MSKKVALKKEFEFYLERQDELVKQYDGKFVVIKNGKIIGVYDDVRTAVETTSKDHKIGTFLVQKCSAGDKDYTAVFHSRVA